MKQRGYFVIGTLFGIQLRIDYSWFIIFILVVWTVVAGYLPAAHPNIPLGIHVLEGISIALLFFGSVVAHEYAHSLVAQRFKLRVRHITLFIFGGASELQREPATPKAELLMTIAGPATSLALGGIFSGLWIASEASHMTVGTVFAAPLASLNIVIGVFNLVPAYPLDGGRVLRAIMWWMSGDLLQATRRAAVVGRVIAALMIMSGVVYVAAGAALGGIWLALLGVFLYQATSVSYFQTLGQLVLATVTVEELMDRRFMLVPAETTVGDFFRTYALHCQPHDSIVMQDKSAVHIVTYSQLARVSEMVRNEALSHYMWRITKSMQLHPQNKASRALHIMTRHQFPLLPVMDNMVPVGVVSRELLGDFITLHKRDYGQTRE